MPQDIKIIEIRKNWEFLCKTSTKFYANWEIAIEELKKIYIHKKEDFFEAKELESSLLMEQELFLIK